jgi:argininosuccinate lyase
MLSALDGLVGTLRFRTDRMAEAAGDWTLSATALAEELVRRGVAFRDAHEIVGKLVSNGSSPQAAKKSELSALHRELPEAVRAIFPK